MNATTISANVHSVHDATGARIGYEGCARVYRDFTQLYQVSAGLTRTTIVEAWADANALRTQLLASKEKENETHKL